MDTAQARDSVIFPQAFTQTSADFNQQLVTYIVAASVVQRLEMIQIEKNEGAVLRKSPTIGNGQMEPLKKQSAIGQASKRIKVGQPVDLGFGLFPLRYVLGKDSDLLAH